MFVFAFGHHDADRSGASDLIPALQATRSDPHDGLQHGLPPHGRASPAHARSRSSSRKWRLALVLLVSCRTAAAEHRAPLRRRRGLRFVGSAHDAGADDRAPLRRMDSATHPDSSTQALEAVRARCRASRRPRFTGQLPMSGDLDQYGAHFEATSTQEAPTYGVFRYAVSPGYVDTMRIPLRARPAARRARRRRTRRWSR